MDPHAFLDRVVQHLPKRDPADYLFDSWAFGGQPTKEGLGLRAVEGVDPDQLIARVMDVDSYLGNVEHVVACRSIADDRYKPPRAVRFYEKINVPMLAKIQMELVLEDIGEREGFRVALWHQLDAETAALDPKEAARSDFNVGAWLAKPGLVGYALASAPRRDDVGFVKFKALTKGADAVAPKVFKANIECLAGWARRR